MNNDTKQWIQSAVIAAVAGMAAGAATVGIVGYQAVSGVAGSVKQATRGALPENSETRLRLEAAIREAEARRALAEQERRRDTAAESETAGDDNDWPTPPMPAPVTWLLWPSGECLHVSREGSCEQRPATSEVGWAAPQFDGPPWFENGRPAGAFDIEFEPPRGQRVTAGGRAAW